MRGAQSWIDSNRELKTSVKTTLVQNQRLSYLASVTEPPLSLDGHAKVVIALPSPVRNLGRGFQA